MSYLKKDLLDYTREDFLSIKNNAYSGTFTDIVIVPTDELHDSGYRCMKFILVKMGEIVGAVSGWSDVVHINGIGGYGDYNTKTYDEALKLDKMPRFAWRIDCLPKSGCVRLFGDRECYIRDPNIICSDFSFYVKEGDNQ